MWKITESQKVRANIDHLSAALFLKSELINGKESSDTIYSQEVILYIHRETYATNNVYLAFGLFGPELLNCFFRMGCLFWDQSDTFSKCVFSSHTKLFFIFTHCYSVPPTQGHQQLWQVCTKLLSFIHQTVRALWFHFFEK